MKKFLFILISLVAAGCARQDMEPPVLPGVVRVAVLPDQASENLRARHQPLLDFLEQRTAIRFELTIPANYEAFQEVFESREVDLAWFGGLTFVRAEQNVSAVPLVLRDIDIQFTSCYLSRASSDRTSIGAFEGENFSFGPQLSTSGHLMPRYFLTRQGIVPEDFFSSVQHSNAHDHTAALVADGTVAVGVANCVIVQSSLNNGQLDGDELRVLGTTPPYSDYVWAVQRSMDESTKLVILDAFLALDATIPAHREILSLQGANAYLPAGSDDFELVRAAAEQAGLLGLEINP